MYQVAEVRQVGRRVSEARCWRVRQVSRDRDSQRLPATRQLSVARNEMRRGAKRSEDIHTHSAHTRLESRLGAHGWHRIALHLAESRVETRARQRFIFVASRSQTMPGAALSNAGREPRFVYTDSIEKS